MPERDLTPIESQFIREEFQWDCLGDVKWDILRNNLRSAQLILENPKRFPNADFERVEQSAAEIKAFLDMECHNYIRVANMADEAVARIQPGYKFLGARGEADRLGITDERQRSVFIHAYLAAMPRHNGIELDTSGGFVRFK